MSGIVVCRPINGISINGVEYLLDENGDIKVFDSEKDAQTYLGFSVVGMYEFRNAEDVLR